jgi:hypothetical protein
MQLSIITGCKVQLKIINEEDSSFIQFSSEDTTEFDRPVESFEEYAKFNKTDYELCDEIECLVSKFGHLNDRKSTYPQQMYDRLEGNNMVQLFSLSNLQRFHELDKNLSLKRQKTTEKINEI